MCGRFAVTLPPDAMARLFNARPANDLPSVPNYNVCPTNRIHSVRSGETGRRLVAMRWGFIPHWYKQPNDGPLLINARAETIAEKPAFKAASRERRCLIPANGFYEWTKDEAGNRLPWFIYRKDRQPLAFAGVWQNWRRGNEEVATCAIITTKANSTISRIHHRMPVIIKETDFGLWLGEEGKGVTRLMQAPEDDFLASHRVSTRVNSNRAEGEGLIAPISVDHAGEAP
ncbi:MAG TPA: SOS response-associated peptidase [Rhodobacteraceae bacterium]|nr:SOS response-associated peptidase [Paracoccaceae bacterium]